VADKMTKAMRTYAIVVEPVAAGELFNIIK